MKKARRTFSRDYKLAAVKKVLESGLSYCEVARDLGIRDTLIHNWPRFLKRTERFRRRSIRARRWKPSSSAFVKRIGSSRWSAIS